MNHQPNDEPAHPIKGALLDYQFTGMTLRDYFAAKAMQANLSRIDVDAGYTMFAEAKYAYEWADAMLKAREA